MAGVDGVALGSIAVGALFAYAGIKGIGVMSALQGLVRGTGPGAGPSSPSSPAAGPPAPGSPAAAGSYSAAQLQALWTANGGDPAQATNAGCHGIQESSGNPDATSANPDGGTNVGLWQLDTKGVGAGYSVAELQNPATNARLTVIGTKNGTDWSDWATPGC